MNGLKLVVLVLLAQTACFAESGEPAGDQTNALLASEKTQATLRAGISAEGVDCRSFQGHTATLGTLTVDCLGTIAPDSYAVNAEGMLERNFTSCPRDATRLLKIDQILSLQRREARLPQVKECFAGAYADFVRAFAQSGVTACPAWQKHKTVNPISASVIDKLVPRLDFSKLLIDEPLQMPAELEVLHIYHASFDADAPHHLEQAGEVGARCAAGFAGFVLQTNGNSMLTDPPAWLLDTTYPGASKDPFLRPGYYHTMSMYNGPPGVQFGDYNRFAPCPNCPPERCSYWAGIHKQTTLQKDCLDDSDLSTCISYCGAALP